MDLILNLNEIHLLVNQHLLKIILSFYYSHLMIILALIPHFILYLLYIKKK